MSTPKTPSTDALGTLISDHPQTVVGNRGRMLQTYIAFGVGGILLVAGLIAYLVMAEGNGQSALLCLGFLGFCILGIGALGLGDARQTMDMSLQLYQHGLFYRDRRGQKTWLWGDITQLLFNSQRMPNTNIVQYVYQVNHKNGERITFYNHIRDPAGAYQTIARQIHPLLLPGLQADFDAGRAVRFGAVTLDPTGVQIKNNAIPWVEVAKVYLSGNALFIEKTSGGLLNHIDINTGEVPNVELAIQLIQQKAQG